MISVCFIYIFTNLERVYIISSAVIPLKLLYLFIDTGPKIVMHATLDNLINLQTLY